MCCIVFLPPFSEQLPPRPLLPLTKWMERGNRGEHKTWGRGTSCLKLLQDLTNQLLSFYTVRRFNKTVPPGATGVFVSRGSIQRWPYPIPLGGDGGLKCAVFCPLACSFLILPNGSDSKWHTQVFFTLHSSPETFRVTLSHRAFTLPTSSCLGPRSGQLFQLWLIFWGLFHSV